LVRGIDLHGERFSGKKKKKKTTVLTTSVRVDLRSSHGLLGAANKSSLLRFITQTKRTILLQRYEAITA